MALLITAAGCSSRPSLPTSDAVGQTLGAVFSSAPEETSFLIQDSSPRVGQVASFALSTSDPKDWTVVAICADDVQLNDASAVEISVVPTASYSSQVKSEVKEGKFLDAVNCEDLRFR
ncbi:hypothetical protein [Microbacterium sp.]|uniref:hypothetical protein n=1 Tax=Microbacterium sp. TaxID=51671 RepID=UPI0033417DB0